jgi:tRNA-Thr(GGU) m(6)t(6)A37 methyltransferase TsaA
MEASIITEDSMNKEQYSIRAVGAMKTGRGTFQALIDEPHAEALKGLEDFSHVCILWWASKLDDEKTRSVTVCESPYKKGPSELGIFATRSPMRPNPICLSVCPVKKIDAAKGIVELWYADTDDGTPVLDIKPYHPSADRVRDARTPGWCSHWPQCMEDSGSFNWQAEFNF